MSLGNALQSYLSYLPFLLRQAREESVKIKSEKNKILSRLNSEKRLEILGLTQIECGASAW